MVAAKRTADDTAPTNTTRSQWAPPAQQQQQPAQQGDGEGPAASEPTYPSGFQSARQQYNKELIKEGKGHLVNNAPVRVHQLTHTHAETHTHIATPLQTTCSSKAQIWYAGQRITWRHT